MGVLDWAEKSGIKRKGDYKTRNCNDKPDFNFGVQNLDDHSVSRMVKMIAPLQQRNYVVMEVKSNLNKEERKNLLAKFPSKTFRKVAQVQVGEPNLEFKKKVQELTLQKKQSISDAAFRQKKAEEKRVRQVE